MKMNLCFTLIACVWLGGACKKEEQAVGPAACELVTQRAEAISKAATAYGTNPTKANCEAYKKAANDYLDAAARCTTVAQADVASARQSVNSLNCQ